VGAWGHDLLENDGAMDAVGELVTELAVAATRTSALTQESDAARFCARLAVILRYEAWRFEPGTADDDGWVDHLRAMVRDNRTTLDKVAPRARALFDALAAGQDGGEKPALEALLAHRHAHAMLQKLADELIDNVEDDLDSEESGAYLDVLGFVGPYVELPRKTVAHWLRRTRELADESDENDQAYLRPRVVALKKLVANLADDEEEDDDD